jgi:hypothetical protein
MSGSNILLGELLCVKLDELVHTRRLPPNELREIIGQSIVSTLLMKFGHRGQMADDMGRHSPFAQFVGPGRDRHVSIPDGPPKRVGEVFRVVVQISGDLTCQIVDATDLRGRFGQYR